MHALCFTSKSFEFMNVHLKAISLPIDHDIFFMCLLKNEKKFIYLCTLKFTIACNTILLIALILVEEQKIGMVSSTIFCYVPIFYRISNFIYNKLHWKLKVSSISWSRLHSVLKKSYILSTLRISSPLLYVDDDKFLGIPGI